MNEATAIDRNASTATEHFDVLIVGAGISGIDAAYHLLRDMPDKTFAILEKQETFGGTWWTHKYPGIRSDSDLYTFGYKWKPWTGVPIATAPEILGYLGEAIEEHGIAPHIRYNQTVLRADWESAAKNWTLTVQNAGGTPRTVTCNFLWMCQGYYRHEEGFTPGWPGMNDFAGQIVHPQTWPEDLDYSGKRVVVIGSGATAATVIPAMADQAAHVTMLQRSPTYFYAKPNKSELAELLEPLGLPDDQVHQILRKRFLYDQKVIAQRSISEPDSLARDLIGAAKMYLGEDFPIDPHFTPGYRPWNQRLAVIPDGDLYQAIRKGQASVVTDQIDRFTPDGIALKSGEHLDADLIVTATGFHMNVLGDIHFAVDGVPLDYASSWAHRGIMFSDVPNMAYIFGYLRTSWTMRADLICEFVIRLLHHMDQTGAETVTPRLRDEDLQMEARPLITSENFSAGYIQRKVHLLPRQGDKDPWIFNQDYHTEKDQIEGADLQDGTLIYS